MLLFQNKLGSSLKSVFLGEKREPVHTLKGHTYHPYTHIHNIYPILHYPLWAYPHMKEKKERKEKERMDEVEIKIEHNIIHS